MKPDAMSPGEVLRAYAFQNYCDARAAADRELHLRTQAEESKRDAAESDERAAMFEAEAIKLGCARFPRIGDKMRQIGGYETIEVVGVTMSGAVAGVRAGEAESAIAHYAINRLEFAE